MRLERVGSPALSPDASSLVYTVRSTNMEKNKGNTQLYLLDVRTREDAVEQTGTFGPIPVAGLDLTPYAFAISALCWGWCLLRYGMFDVVPISR